MGQDKINNKYPSLTILIPAYNETNRITSSLDKIDEYISKKNNLIKVLIVNDGSTDDTELKVNTWIQKNSKNKDDFELLSYTPNRGKGYAIREGFLKINTDVVLYTDADCASPVEESERLVGFLKDGYDIICGSRILRNNNTKVKMSFMRRCVGFVFHTFLFLLGLANLKDTQCGFKLFKTPAAKKIATSQQCFNYSFDVEYLYLAKKFGYKIKEVSVNWQEISGSKVNVLRDSIKMLIGILKIRFVYKYNKG